MELNKVYLGDCLEESKGISNGSVDLILTDPPYGTMNGFNGIDWDFTIDPINLFEVANRILRKNGKLILFSQEPYTSELITNSIANLPFSYRMIWEKDNFANALLSKKAPVGYYEDILVFSKTHCGDDSHPLRDYFKNVINFIGKSRTLIIKEIGGRADHVTRVNSTQFSLCTEETYNIMIELYNLKNMDNFKTFNELKAIDEQVKANTFPSTFNLWEGGNYKSNIFKYKKDYTGLHPTQKPVLLLEDLIKTYSNLNDTVVDLTCGSGSTAIACKNTERNFICFEMNERYYNLAQERINTHIPLLV